MGSRLSKMKLCQNEKQSDGERCSERLTLTISIGYLKVVAKSNCPDIDNTFYSTFETSQPFVALMLSSKLLFRPLSATTLPFRQTFVSLASSSTFNTDSSSKYVPVPAKCISNQFPCVSNSAGTLQLGQCERFGSD